VIRGRYPASLAGLALACLAKDPAARPTMPELAERLTAAAAERPRRRRWLWFAAAAAVIVIACGVAVAAPSLLDPLCGDWFGAPVFRFVRRGAHAAHAAVFPAPPRPHSRR
jgi:hypothetical protein